MHGDVSMTERSIGAASAPSALLHPSLSPSLAAQARITEKGLRHECGLYLEQRGYDK
jgi:hypothetical protein